MNAAEIKMYSFMEIAQILRVSRQTVYNFHTKKLLKAVKIGREYRVTDTDLREFIKNGRNI